MTQEQYHRLYSDLAWLWPYWDHPDEYANYTNHANELIKNYTQRPVQSVLNIACGGGKNAFNLKKYYDVIGLDRSPEMLKLARELNPECEFVQGDMRSFSLGRCFDAIFMDDGIAYVTSLEDLTSSFQMAHRHLNGGGVMVVAPDDTTETFVQNRTVVTPSSGTPQGGNIEVTFIENDYDPDPTDTHYEGAIVYLIRENGHLRVETDRHILGLFPLDAWRESLRQVGFEIHESSYTEDDKDYVTFACVKALD